MNHQQPNLLAKHHHKVVFALKIVCFFVFFGRGWQHLFWDAPLRAFFWDEGLLRPLVEGLFNMNWEDYVPSSAVDKSIQILTRLLGAFYMVCAMVAIWPKPIHKRVAMLLPIGSVLLSLLAFLYFKEQFYRVGQLIEYASQVAAPALLYGVLRNKLGMARLQLYLKLAIALTFIGHGLYAVGYYPQPGVFIDMVINIFGFGEITARQLLVGAGFLDFVVALLIFLPPYTYSALVYAFVWGGLTALARVVGYLSLDYGGGDTIQVFFETIYRLPHAGFPLLSLMIMRYSKDIRREANALAIKPQS